MPAFPVKRFFGFVGALLAALAGLAALAAIANAGEGVVSTPVQQSPPQVRSYWTPEKMRDADPVGLPQQAGSPQFVRAARSGHDAAPTAAATQIPPRGGAALFDFEPGSETSFPQSVHGRVFFNVPASDSHPEELASCSGTVVSSRLQNVVFTAGHCAQYPGDAPSTNMVFVPGYRDGAEPFGEYPVANLITDEAWTKDGDLSFDVAVAQLASPIEQTLGARGIAFNKPPKTSYRIFGYPAEPYPRFDGERLIECDASFYGLEASISHPFSTVVYPCEMQEGSSGGGWVNPKGQVVSVVSHGYTDPALANQIAGPYFGDAIKRLYNAAGGSAQCPPARKALKRAKKRFRRARKVARRSSSRRAAKRLRKAHRRLGKARGRRDTYC